MVGRHPAPPGNMPLSVFLSLHLFCGSLVMSDKPKLRLEWIEAGSLAENPNNWRKHPAEQLQSLRDLVQDPSVGWAGACLFNERTGRLIDGHARKSIADPKSLVPVLVGDWSEEAEAKILLTLDPIAGMARGDAALYEKLAETVEADSLWVRDLIHATNAALAKQVESGEAEDEGPPPASTLPEMEAQPFEHHDYIMVMFKNEQDWSQACERLGIGRVKIQYPGGSEKIGVGRVIDGARFLRFIAGENPPLPGEVKAP